MIANVAMQEPMEYSLFVFVWSGCIRVTGNSWEKNDAVIVLMRLTNNRMSQAIMPPTVMNHRIQDVEDWFWKALTLRYELQCCQHPMTRIIYIENSADQCEEDIETVMFFFLFVRINCISFLVTYIVLAKPQGNNNALGGHVTSH